MLKVAKWIVKNRIAILIVSILLLIPAAFGYFKTRINYDILSYLPESLETVKGQDIMVDEFGMGAFSMVVVEDMPMKDEVKLEKKIEGVDHVKDVIWYDDLLDTSVPVEMLPAELRNALFNGNATMMIALFDDTTSADSTMDAVTQIRKIAGKQAFVSGMSAVTTDIKMLVEKEVFIYVAIAVVLSIIILLMFMNSWATPFLFLLNIGMAIIYNMGTNFMLKDVSYLTQALAAVLQLAVTMDYSIFLLNSYEQYKVKYGQDDKQRAMAHAVSNTFVSISSSSVTTIAGFAALLVMTFKLGANIGLVMIKGVILGVIACVTILPAIILSADKLIDRTTHKPLIPAMDKVSEKVIKGRWVFLAIFAIMLVPAIYGNNHYKIYYDIARSLPSSLQSAVANKKLEKDFKMNATHIVLLKNGLSDKQKNDMINEMKEVKGVKWVLGMNSIKGPAVPDEILPKEANKLLKGKKYEALFVSSNYKTATDPMNAQIKKLDKIVKSYSKSSMVIGEAPLMKDLQETNDIDMVKVNSLSIIAIFVIILLTFKSISLPVILVAAIEFAIAINMAIPFFMGTELPFVASVCIGTVQLGSTVDYAILFTSNYTKMRTTEGMTKAGAIKMAHRLSMRSVMTSGFCFFAATFGVALYSNIDMISSLCTLLARGAVISTFLVILLVPALFWLFDPIIIRTTIDMRKQKVAARDKAHKSIDELPVASQESQQS